MNSLSHFLFLIIIISSSYGEDGWLDKVTNWHKNKIVDDLNKVPSTQLTIIIEHGNVHNNIQSWTLESATRLLLLMKSVKKKSPRLKKILNYLLKPSRRGIQKNLNKNGTLLQKHKGNHTSRSEKDNDTFIDREVFNATLSAEVLNGTTGGKEAPNDTIRRFAPQKWLGEDKNEDLNMDAMGRDPTKPDWYQTSLIKHPSKDPFIENELYLPFINSESDYEFDIPYGMNVNTTVVHVSNPVEARLPSSKISVYLLKSILEREAEIERMMPSTSPHTLNMSWAPFDEVMYYNTHTTYVYKRENHSRKLLVQYPVRNKKS